MKPQALLLVLLAGASVASGQMYNIPGPNTIFTYWYDSNYEGWQDFIPIPLDVNGNPIAGLMVIDPSTGGPVTIKLGAGLTLDFSGGTGAKVDTSYVFGTSEATSFGSSILSSVNGTIGSTIQAHSSALDTFASNGSSHYLNRANHTGTQLASTISDFSTAVGLLIPAQQPSDWTASSGPTRILNKPAIPATVGTPGTYGAVTTNSFGQVTSGKRVETYSVTTNSSGVASVTLSASFSAAPNIQLQPANFSSDNQFARVTSISATGFSVIARLRTDLVGLLPTFSNINSATIDVLITEK